MSHNYNLPKYFVMSCFDYRISDDVYNYMPYQSYDDFTLAGASLGMNINSQWRETLFQNIDLALELHSISTVAIFDHEDCGYYKYIYGTDKFEDHVHNLSLAKRLIENEYPELEVETKYTFISSNKGTINI